MIKNNYPNMMHEIEGICFKNLKTIGHLEAKLIISKARSKLSQIVENNVIVLEDLKETYQGCDKVHMIFYKIAAYKLGLTNILLHFPTTNSNHFDLHILPLLQKI